MMAQILRPVRQRPLITFFVLAYVLSWWPWIFYALDLAPQPIVGFGPFLAAVVVLGITHGKSGVVMLLRRMVQWAGRARWPSCFWRSWSSSWQDLSICPADTDSKTRWWNLVLR
jgi:hypothetical protein